jgi:hypothetical protein
VVDDVDGVSPGLPIAHSGPLPRYKSRAGLSLSGL